ncbi:hypothetical protein OSTOST_16378, partial [Ostertagia ostertagi]
ILLQNYQLRNGIVEIAGKTHPYELCFNEDCRKFVGDGIAMTYELPISPLHNATNVTVNYINNEGPMVFTTICANPEFCSKSNSLFSPSLLGNPHCWPVGAIVSVALIAYFMMVIMIIPIWFIVSLFRSRDSQPSTNIQINCNNTTHAENINLHSWNPAPLSAAICKGAAACQHGFTRHATDIICNQDGICSYEFSREFLFNRIQTVHCIEIRSQNKTVGFLKMRNTAVILTCSKVSKFFSKSTELRIYSRVRCAQMGSCHGNVCDLMRPNQTVSELSRARKYPGYSGCQYTCGGLSCGCALPSPSCTFYRVAHVPISKQVFEIIECRDWVPSVQVELETTLFGKTQKGSLFLEPYLTSKFYTFNVTAVSVQKPTLSLLGKRFAISQNRSMILPDQFVVPVECATLEEATMNFQNCVNKIICDCNTGWTKHHCQCPQTSLRQISTNSDHILPLSTPSMEIHSNGREIFAISADVESTVTVQSRFLMETVNFVDDEKCKVELSSLTGCYNCIQGAQITALCETKNPTEVAVHCAHNTFVIECGPTNPQNVVKLSYDHAVVNQHCFSVCGNENVTIPLNGTLLYHAERHQSVFDFNQELKHKQNFMESIADIKIPDLSPLLNTIRAHWKLAMVAATSVMFINETIKC